MMHLTYLNGILRKKFCKSSKKSSKKQKFLNNFLLKLYKSC